MSFTAGAGTRFVVTSTVSQSSGTALIGPITVTAGTATADTPAFNITQTWNNAAVTFTGLRFNITDTASNASSLLMDLQVGGVSSFYVQKNGNVWIKGNGYSYLLNANSFPNVLSFQPNGAINTFSVGDAPKASRYDFGSTAVAVTDLIIIRDAANTLAQRNGVNPQTFNIYNTFTDASNYERLAATWSSNVAYIRPQNAGTGSARLFVPVTGATTVATLPAAATAGAGARAFVTDATVTTFASIVAGGGANAVPVVSTGTNWIIG